ncbi:MAG: DNA repair protein RadA [Clostridiaceae bacterium]|nr:DNA repair protein RadA [Clostridiaceae bacterium]
MAKGKSRFFCSECGQETSGWLGRCPGCGAWNTLVEEKVAPAGQSPSRGPWTGTGSGDKSNAGTTVQLADVTAGAEDRLSSGIHELDRVLGGGFVKGSLVLIGGDPGIGKSTLLLQALRSIGNQHKTLYISGEESPQQIRLRADRLGLPGGLSIAMLAATDFTTIAATLNRDKPDLAIVDSIQTLYVEELSAAPGSVSQIREATAGLLRLAKNQNITIVLVGHVTKDGSLAGPRVLEHMVDTVLYFEGEHHQSYRILRAVKNRFGATDELGIFEMTDHGLQEVDNASQALLSGRPIQVPGSVVTACMEGTRPILVEIQALLNESAYGSPQRMAQGLDRNRITMLLAVLEKQFRFGLNNMDTYTNVVGGLRVDETAVDLAVVAAIISSLKNKPIRASSLVFGEVGLTGEIRSIGQADRRIQEAARLGFTSFILPGSCRPGLSKVKLPDSCDLFYVDRINEALDLLFD